MGGGPDDGGSNNGVRDLVMEKRMLDELTTPRLVVGGAHAGVGKSTVTRGLVAAMRRRGRVVQPFKVGPDVVGCAQLAHASGRSCRNLDAWVLGPDSVRRSLGHGTVGADCAIIDGVMGLFDGHGMGSAAGATADAGSGIGAFPGSTAQLARIIDSPVVLVVDADVMGETAAAVALGIRLLDPELNVIGVILNNVAGELRRSVIEDAMWGLAKLPVLGALPRIPQEANPDQALAELVANIERHCDVNLIDRLMQSATPLPLPVRIGRPAEAHARIGVAFDDAFSFYNAENLEALQDAGAEIVNFSPLEDEAIPRDVGALYLGGGVAEAHVPQLAANRAFIDTLVLARAQGMPIYAECGGLQYSARRVQTSDGVIHQMASLLPVDIAMDGTSCHSGYRELTVASDGLLGPAGTRIRGHEFHSSRILDGVDTATPAYSMHDSYGEPLGSEGWVSGQFLASFIHVHFGQDLDLARRLVAAAAAYSAKRVPATV